MPPRAARLRAVLDRIEEAFMALCLAVMTVVTFVQVVLRYVFGSGLVWSLEATTYAFAWLVLIGMSYGVRTKAHIAVDLVTSKLGPAAARVVAFAALGTSLAYCGFMVFAGAQFVDRLIALGNNARDIPLPRWLLTSVLPIAFALLALRLLEVGWRFFLHRSGDDARMSATTSGRETGPQ